MRAFLILAAATLALSVPAPAFSASATGAMPSCAASDPAVWVNTSTKVYHMQGDPYYGNTSHGKYMCKSAADAAGNHASKSTSGTAPKPQSTAAGKHHSHKKPKASPAPAPAAT